MSWKVLETVLSHLKTQLPINEMFRSTRTAIARFEKKFLFRL